MGAAEVGNAELLFDPSGKHRTSGFDPFFMLSDLLGEGDS